MKKAQGKAYAKINLTLDVGNREESGFHAVRTVMQEISLCDDVKLVECKCKKLKIKLHSNAKYLPRDERNNAVKAAKRFYAAAGIYGACLDIHIFKRIPVAGGLGGSSTDAACVLKLLNGMHSDLFDEKKLAGLASEIGSDDAFFLIGGTALCEGRGNEITKLPPMPMCHILVARMGQGLSTSDVYAAFDETEAKSAQVAATDALVDALEENNLTKIAGAISNMLEPAAMHKDGTVAELINFMTQNGALKACMSGSGSCVYGVFDSLADAENCKARIEEKFEQAETFLTFPKN